MSSASDVALIVPVGGAAPAWERCAASLARLEPPPGELVVVIDGPNAAQRTRAETLGAEVVVLEERGGPARARNRGVEASRAGILLFIDSDIEVPTDLVAQVAELFPKDVDVPPAVFGSYDDAPGDPAFVSQYRNIQHHFVHQTGHEEASTRRVRGGRRLQRALHRAQHRGHRARRAPAPRRAWDPPGPAAPGQAPEAVDFARHAAHGSLAPRRAVDTLDARRGRAGQ